MANDEGAASLLREVGLLPDGPVLWGRPLTSHGPGIYLVEMAETRPRAPLDMTRVGAWLERVPGLRLDGARPTPRTLAARLDSLWLPTETVLYIGATTRSVGGRVLALAHHVPGDRRPHADGQWLHALVGIDRARVWWSETDATEEYLDAIVEAFAAGAARRLAAASGPVDGRQREARPADALLLPWANGRRPSGERQAHGITGAVLPDDTVPAPPTTIVNVAAGNADGVPAESRGTGVTRRAPRVPPSVDAGRPAGSIARRAAERASSPSRTASGRSSTSPRTIGGTAAQRDAAARAARIEAVPLTRDSMARLEQELHELTQVRRPGIVARIKAARELGDLKENAEYQAAREEQSFLEGRVRLLEDRKRNAVIIEEVVTGRVGLGSVVEVEADGATVTYTIVGTTDADPSAGRISSSSPVGAALIGAVAGAEVDVRTPRGAARYRVIVVR